MEGHKAPFWSKEAAVDALTKATFLDKYLIIKGLFEISKGKQNAPKTAPIASNLGEQEKFSFPSF